MKAIMLAAGVGKRLASVVGRIPKCLIEIGGQSLLSRHLDNLAGLGVGQVVIVVGYEQQRIRDAVAVSGFPGAARFIVNEQYTRGSITSFWEARAELNEDVVVMDADVLYHPEILRRLVESPHPNALLVDETVTQETEECMVAIQNNRVICLSKRLPAEYDFAGEGVGFLKVAQKHGPQLIQSVQRSIESGQLDMEYEDALKDFFDEVEVGHERIGGLPWIEIDFPEDIRRAECEVLPALSAFEKEAV